MATNWTPAQRHAMETKGRNLLLSAAAGSGKTATLTARIIRSLTADEHPADISRLLIVTFTRAAAGELKTRISAALSQALAEHPGNRHLTQQLISIGSAPICTIDSFCLSLVRSHFQSLSLPPDFRLADETELAVLRRSVMEELIEEYYDKKTDGMFAALTEHFTGMRNDGELAPILTDIYQKIAAYPEGLSFLKSCGEQYEAEADLPFLETHFGATVKRLSLQRLQGCIAQMESAVNDILDGGDLQKAYERSFSHDLTTCRTLYHALEENDYETVRITCADYAPIRVGSLSASKKTPESIRACEIRSQVVDDLRKKLTPHFLIPQPKLPSLFRATKQVCEGLYELLSDYEQRLTAEKLARAVCDFGDITRLTYRLLVAPDGTPTETAREISQQYDEIYIDEYQDVDAVQDAIFRAIAKPNNRFMVGDIKQSIYGFRGSEPSIFADYRRNFPILGNDAGEDPTQLSESIFMSENFRCDRHVIAFVNAICSYLFAACGESIGYVPRDDLIFSKKESEGYLAPKVQVFVTVPPEKEEEEEAPPVSTEDEAEEDTAEKPEVRLIVGEIRRLLASGTKADGTPIRPGDIAILSRTTTCHQAIADALEAAGIPTATAEQKDFFENPEVLLLLCLLNTIDNPTRDIPLAGVLRSPLFGFTMDDLVLIRSRTADSPLIDAVRAMGKADENDPLTRRCRDFLDILNRYRDAARAMPVDKLLRQLYRETCMLAYAGSGKQGGDRTAVRTRRTNLLRFYEYARRFEAGSFKGLYQFIGYINGIIEEGTTIQFGGSTSGDAVSIMTIHKSKGLEFPVCFVCNTSSKFSAKDTEAPLLFDRKMGLAIRLPDSTGFARLNTPMRIAIADYRNEQLREEEMRLLYVALTRSREYLYVTAGSRSRRESLQSKAALRASHSHGGLRTALMDCNSYLEWILTAIETERGREAYEYRFFTPSELEEYLSVQSSTDPILPDPEEATAPSHLLDEEQLRMWQNRFNFRYPYEHLTTLPSKISVSDLHPAVLDQQLGIEEDDARFAEEDTHMRLQISRADQFPQADDMSTMVEKWLSRTPAFCHTEEEKTVSASERGTATHLFLQFCDMERTHRCGVRAEAERLTAERFLPPYVAAQIREEELTRFFESEFYGRLRNARRTWREQRFQLLLPASDFTENEDYARELSGEVLLVQGVIDLFFETEDGKLILCDYKTDALTAAEIRNPALARKKLSARHARQLSYYALALEQLCGRRPDEVLIYSLPLGDTIRPDIGKTAKNVNPSH